MNRTLACSATNPVFMRTSESFVAAGRGFMLGGGIVAVLGAACARMGSQTAKVAPREYSDAGMLLLVVGGGAVAIGLLVFLIGLTCWLGGRYFRSRAHTA